MVLDLILAALALATSLSLRPWRMLRGAPPLLTPLLATLVILPWMWALPVLHHSPLQLQWSGAVLVLLMLGWPLAVPVFLLVGLGSMLVAPVPWDGALSLAVWLGIVPATFALGLGAVLRRWLPDHPFIYVLGRGFLGAVACLFASRVLAGWLGSELPGVSGELGLVARWLMSWGDAFVTGMLTAIFVAFRPQWLVTWSDARYLRRP